MRAINFFESIKWYLMSIAGAVLGGFVRGISCPKSEFTWWVFVQRVMAALLVGVITTLILAHIEIPETTKTAVAAASGWGANDVLESLKPWVKRKLGL